MLNCYDIWGVWNDMKKNTGDNAASTCDTLLSTVSASELYTFFAWFNKELFSSEIQDLFSSLSSTGSLEITENQVHNQSC